jgi:hypothetical protein
MAGVTAALTAGSIVVALAPGATASAAPAAARRGAPAAARPATLPKNLLPFAHCPVGDRAVSVCLYSSMATTQFTIGSTTVSSTRPTTISLGLVIEPNGSIVAILPTDGTAALNAPSIPLPGGLLGIPGADAGPLAVDVKPELAGTPVLSLTNLLSRHGTGFEMPIQVLVSSPTGVLGSACTLGSATSPIQLRLTTGTTKPPAPNTPISGSAGKLSSGADSELIVSGMKVVDNSFAVPGASNCGPTSLLTPVVDEVIDAQKGLPSAAGKNTAILTGSSYTVPAAVIRKYLG